MNRTIHRVLAPRFVVGLSSLEFLRRELHGDYLRPQNNNLHPFALGKVNRLVQLYGVPHA